MNRQKSFQNENSTLYLVATPIGNLSEMTYRAVEILQSVDYIAAEDTRNTIKLLNHFNISKKLISHHEHNIKSSTNKIISLLEEGANIALVSDAGYPAISDPGAELVNDAIENGFNVVSVSGANACINALVVSGIKPQPFLFYGFLDHQDKKKKKELEELKYYKETIVFYESPHRIEKTLKLMLNILGNRNIALCRELTKKHEEIIRGNIEDILNIIDTIKGELVIIVEGSHELKQEDVLYEQSIKDHVDEFINNGLSTKDAIKEVAKLRKLNKNAVYNEYHSKED
jgi:16S rRNA (cytidine1402-2'-O)-methyltransferase